MCISSPLDIYWVVKIPVENNQGETEVELEPCCCWRENVQFTHNSHYLDPPISKQFWMGGNSDFHPFFKERFGNHHPIETAVKKCLFWVPGNNSMVKTSSLQRQKAAEETADLLHLGGISREIGRRATRFTWTNDTGRKDVRHRRMSLTLRTVSNTWNWFDDVHLEGDLDFPRSLKVYLAHSLYLCLCQKSDRLGFACEPWHVTRILRKVYQGFSIN